MELELLPPPRKDLSDKENKLRVKWVQAINDREATEYNYDMDEYRKAKLKEMCIYATLCDYDDHRKAESGNKSSTIFKDLMYWLTDRNMEM